MFSCTWQVDGRLDSVAPTELVDSTWVIVLSKLTTQWSAKSGFIFLFSPSKEVSQLSCSNI